MTTKQKNILIVLVFLVGLLALILALIVFSNLFGNKPASIPTENPVSNTPTETSIPEATPSPVKTDLVWQNISTKNSIIVGISADYPPYSYIDKDFKIQGFDIALFSEIGKRLNLPIDYKNMAFDGIISAIQLGQLDAAVAAISVTSEREAVVDFSNVYYVGEEAVLAQKDTNIQINSLSDMQRYRVGVQRGSVYESWLRENLVDLGLMPARNLISYATPQDALSVLVSPNSPIDILVMDYQPAEIAIRSAPAKIVGKQLNPQRFAIAIPEGAFTLQEKINQALLEIQNDGTLAELARQYLNVANLPPLPTAIPPLPTAAPQQPTATPAPQACLDGMAFIQDLNYQDNSMLTPPQIQPGVVIQKGWRILNTGTCTWDSSYSINYLDANPRNAPVGGNPVVIQGKVSPGQTYDVYVNLTTPWQPGTYQSFWAMRNKASQYFGSRIYAGFQVVSPVTATPPPQAPVIINFISSPGTISQGQCVALSWQFQGRDLILSRLYRDNDIILTDLPYSGVYTDCPTNSGQVKYHLSVDSEFAGSALAAQVVNVIPAPQPTPTQPPIPELPPIIDYFIVDQQQISLGECVNLSWSYRGTSLVSAQITRNSEIIISDASISGSAQDCPASPGQITYRLNVYSEFADSAHNEQYVTVYPQVSPEKPPEILFFTVDPQQTFGNENIRLSWSISGTSLVASSLQQDGQEIATDVLMNDSFEVWIDPAWQGKSITFTLIVYSEAGSAQAEVQVVVQLANG